MERERGRMQREGKCSQRSQGPKGQMAMKEGRKERRRSIQLFSRGKKWREIKWIAESNKRAEYASRLSPHSQLVTYVASKVLAPAEATGFSTEVLLQKVNGHGWLD